MNRIALRTARGPEGRYLFRTNLAADDSALIWRCYVQLCHVEEAFHTLKGDLGLWPIFYHKAEWIETPRFVAFLAYCLTITLRQQLARLAPSLMSRVVLEQLATVQLLNVAGPTTDGRELLLVRRTEASQGLALLLDRLAFTLSPQPPPKIQSPRTLWRPLASPRASAITSAALCFQLRKAG